VPNIAGCFRISPEELFQSRGSCSRQGPDRIGGNAKATLSFVESRRSEKPPKMREVVERMRIDSLANSLSPLSICYFHIADRPIENGCKNTRHFTHGRYLANQIVRILMGFVSVRQEGSGAAAHVFGARLCPIEHPIHLDRPI
jgi:hypothetical protein